MKRPSSWKVIVITIGAAAIVAMSAVAQQPATPPAASAAATPQQATARIVAAARALLSTLDDAGRAKVQFRFDDQEQRKRWSNLPVGSVSRAGLRLGDLTSTQRSAVMTLMEVALSRPGYQKVLDIMEGDEVLRTGDGGNGRGGGRDGGRRGGGPPPGGAPQGGPPPGGGRGPGGGAGPSFGKDNYFVSFVGAPSTTDPWMLQFGGHHLAINLTMGGSQATMAPSLPAAQPATFTIEGRTVRPLGRENDKAFALINALDQGQRGQAILNSRVADLVLGPGQDGRTIAPEGVRATSLSTSQQTMLMELIREWAGIMTDGYANERMAELKANLPQTYFAWSGPTTNGSAAYFRVQGPTLVIEYAPQQGSVDHIHTIYRDPTNDYGAKFARK